ncbi:MAG: nitroreductase family protein [Candidatus Cloacimonadales bacterium]
MLLEAIKNRFSVRKFLDQPIEKEKLDEILEAARLAPSARNIQPWKFVVIQSQQQREALAAICKGQKFVAAAPLTIAICCTNLDYQMSCGQTAAVIDGALAGEHIVLQAAELGLGSCWIGAFFQDQLAQLINLPADWQVIGLLPIGYPDISRSERQLKPRDQVIAFDQF